MTFLHANRDSADVPPDLIRMLGQAERIVGFTGAGVSTESGIPDFRSPGGVWTRYDPRNFEFDRYLTDPAVRRDSWAMRREFFAAEPVPNAAHRAFATWERGGVSPGVITQNIDGLHQAAGSATVHEVHGSARRVICLGPAAAAQGRGGPAGCGWQASHQWAFDRIDGGDPDPHCPECGGLVKSATVSFGQMLEPAVIDAAIGLARSADVLLTVGSSLQVYPAAALPLQAIEAGARLVIINDEPTDLDDYADVVLRGRAGQILDAIQRALGDGDGVSALGALESTAASTPAESTDGTDVSIGEYAFPGPLRDRLVAAILDGSKTSTTSLLGEYEHEGVPLPQVGDREVVVDSANEPVAITEITDVRVLPLSEIDHAHAVAEGEGFASVAQWRAGHEEFWHSQEYREAVGDSEFTVTDATLAVCVRMRVIRTLNT